MIIFFCFGLGFFFILVNQIWLLPPTFCFCVWLPHSPSLWRWIRSRWQLMVIRHPLWKVTTDVNKSLCTNESLATSSIYLYNICWTDWLSGGLAILDTILNVCIVLDILSKCCVCVCVPVLFWFFLILNLSLFSYFVLVVFKRHDLGQMPTPSIGFSKVSDPPFISFRSELD